MRPRKYEYFRPGEERDFSGCLLGIVVVLLGAVMVLLLGILFLAYLD